MGRHEKACLAGIAALFVGISTVGITWGLPGLHLDAYLFGDDPPWTGETIYRLAGAEKKFAPTRGADVDVDPVELKASAEPLILNATPEDAAKIYLRYRLYSRQPDEMITLMALAGMRPSQLQFDPKLYQYGGLFIYPVGALIKLCGALGLIDVRNDVAFYLDHPDEFSKFYLAARGYASAWGVIGVFVVFAIARRFGGTTAGLLAALLYALLPVVICMAHEGKPHLPGAVFMLVAVWIAMHVAEARPSTEALDIGSSLETNRNAVKADRGLSGKFWLLCAVCGAAVGMVLSSVPILILIPCMAAHRCTAATPASGMRGPKLLGFLGYTFAGIILAGLVYALTNLYVLINLCVNREVLRSNFGNSLAMYEVDRFAEGFLRVLELTVEGAGSAVLILGGIAGAMAVSRKRWVIVPLAVPAGLFFLQFVLIGAGKPSEYGRFGIFTNAALAIGAACAVAVLGKRKTKWPAGLAGVAAVVWTAICGSAYLRNFHLDAAGKDTRIQLAEQIRAQGAAVPSEPRPAEIGVLREPAPYCCPPVNFARTKLALYGSVEQFQKQKSAGTAWLLEPVDKSVMPSEGHSAFSILFSAFTRPTSISWANKPFHLERRRSHAHAE